MPLLQKLKFSLLLQLRVRFSFKNPTPGPAPASAKIVDSFRSLLLHSASVITSEGNLARWKRWKHCWFLHQASRDDHYPVCQVDIRPDSEFATGYGYPKTAFKQKPDTDSDIRNAFIDISRVQTYGKSCKIIHFVSWIFGSSFSGLESWWLEVLSMMQYQCRSVVPCPTE